MLHDTSQAFPTIQSPSKILQVSIRFELKMSLRCFFFFNEVAGSSHSVGDVNGPA